MLQHHGAYLELRSGMSLFATCIVGGILTTLGPAEVNRGLTEKGFSSFEYAAGMIGRWFSVCQKKVPIDGIKESIAGIRMFHRRVFL